jgi:hypothetical protein
MGRVQEDRRKDVRIGRDVGVGTRDLGSCVCYVSQASARVMLNWERLMDGRKTAAEKTY